MMFFLICLLIITSFNFSELAKQSRIDLLRNETLNSQLKVVTKNDNKAFFKLKKLDKKLSDISGVEKVVPRIGEYAYHNKEKESVYIVGANLQKQDEAYRFALLNYKKDALENKKGIIISEEYSKDHKVFLGDKIKISYENRSAVFSVVGICEKGNALADPNEMFVQIEQAQKLFGRKNQVYSIGVTISKLEEIELAKNEIETILPAKLKCESEHDLYQFNNMVQTITIVINIFALLSIIITMFLCFSIYRTFIYDRLKQSGTLRCIGTTQTQITLSYFLEYILVVLPFILAGIFVSKPFVEKLVYTFCGYTSELNVSNLTFSLSVIFLFALINPVPSLAILIRKVSSNTVSLMKGQQDINQRKLPVKLFSILFLVVFFGVSAYFYQTTNSKILLLLNGLFLSVLFFIIISSVLKLVIYLVGRFSTLVFQKKSVTSELLFQQVKGVNYTIVLLTISIGLCIVSLLISQVVSDSMIGVYNKSDIILNNLNTEKNKSVTNKLDQISAIKYYTKSHRKEMQIGDQEVLVSSITPDKYAPVSFESFSKGTNKENFDKLLEKNTIILSSNLAKTLNKKEGDHIKIKDGKKIIKYKIVSLVDTFENLGKIAFISEDNYRERHKTSYTTYLITVAEGADPDKVQEKINKKIDPVTNFNISTIEEMQEMTNEDNEVIFSLVNVLIIMVLIITLIGLVNHISISIMGRRKSYSIMRMLGMEFKKIYVSLALEGLVWGLFTGISGILYGVILNRYILLFITEYIGRTNPSEITIPYWLGGINVIICLFSYLICYRYLRKGAFVSYLRGDES